MCDIYIYIFSFSIPSSRSVHVYIYRRYHMYRLTHKPCIHTIKLNSSDSSPNKCCRNVPLPTGDDLQFNCSSPNRQTIFWIHTFTSTLQIGQVALVWKIEEYSFNSNRFQPHTCVKKLHADLTLHVLSETDSLWFTNTELN